jgi:hypothetical protein
MPTSHEVDQRQKSREAVHADFDKREAFSQKI